MNPHTAGSLSEFFYCRREVLRADVWRGRLATTRFLSVKRPLLPRCT